MEFIAHMFPKRSDVGAPILDAPPRGVRMMSVRPKGAEIVSAHLAVTDGATKSERGDLSYKSGEHYLVRYENGDQAPVLKILFERLYRRRDDGRYEKRRDIVLRCFTLPHAVRVLTMEGPRLAKPGDWIMEGVLGELYPVPARAAEAKYERVA